MDVILCKRCKKMFQYIAGPALCPRCRQLEEEEFQKVKDYLRENPGANMYEINEATGVEAGLVKKFLKEGRLEVSPDSPMSLTCENCGKRITSGRYCNSCKEKMTMELNEIKASLINENKPKEQEHSGPKMRYLKSDQLR